jgi:hypothetical protein
MDFLLEGSDPLLSFLFILLLLMQSSFKKKKHKQQKNKTKQKYKKSCSSHLESTGGIQAIRIDLRVQVQKG